MNDTMEEVQSLNINVLNYYVHFIKKIIERYNLSDTEIIAAGC